MKDDDTDKTLEVWQAARKEMRRLQGEHNKAIAALDEMRATQEANLQELRTTQLAVFQEFHESQKQGQADVLARVMTLSDEYSRAVNKVRTLGTKMQSSVGDEVSRDQGSIAGGLRKTASEKAEAERVAQEQAEAEKAAAKAVAKALAEAADAPPPPDQPAEPPPP